MMILEGGESCWRRMLPALAGLHVLVLLLFVTSSSFVGTHARFAELYHRDNRSPAARLGPPVRPKVFETSDQLTTYLAELADYYAVLGRPR